MGCHISLIGDLSVSPSSFIGRGLLTLPHAAFPFVDFKMHPFSVINHNYEYNSFLESREFFERITEPEVCLGKPWHNFLYTPHPKYMVYDLWVLFLWREKLNSIWNLSAGWFFPDFMIFELMEKFSFQKHVWEVMQLTLFGYIEE